MATELELILGTYEDFLLGYKVGYSTKDPGKKLSLIQSFATKVHTASVRCVASSGNLLASGGADDRIIVLDMKKRTEINTLIHHDDTVNTLEFAPNGTHLLSGGADGMITVTRVGSWLLEKKWEHAHKSEAITCISMHPSGKLALSLGNDLTLRTWNLVKGRLAYATNLNSKKTLGKTIDCVQWSTDGNHFSVAGTRIVEVYNLNTAGNVKSIACDVKPTTIRWINEKRLLVGLDNGNIILCCLDEQETKFETKLGRIKDIQVFKEFVATIASSGEVTLWQLSDDADNNHLLTSLCSTNIGCRPTCLTIMETAKYASIESMNNEEEKVKELNDLIENANENKLKNTVGSVIVEMEVEENDEIVEKKAKKKSKRKPSDTEGTEVESAIEETVAKSKTNKIKLKKKKTSQESDEKIEDSLEPSENSHKKKKNKKDKLNESVPVHKHKNVEDKKKKRKSFH